MKSNVLMTSLRLAALVAASLAPGMAACSYSATSPVAGAGGGYVAMQVYTQPGCVWQAAEYSPFVSIVSGRQGRGSGTVTIYVSPNSGGARTGLVKGLLYIEPTLGGRSASPGGWITVFQSVVTEYGR